MSDRIVDLAAERARRRRAESTAAPDTAGTCEALDLMGLAVSAWQVGWVKLWISMWELRMPIFR